jgi:hypothetical protein
MLVESATLNPGPWVSHSRHVALGAQLIAARCSGLDPDRAYVLGLLHDIGRRFGITGMRHVLDGYQFLMAQGYDGAARASITHSYPIKDNLHGASPWDGDAQEWRIVARFIANIDYDDYDRLIQLCDSLAMPGGFCLLEKRLLDVTLRYGCNEHTVMRWKAYMHIKEHFDSLIGGSIYRVLPEVVNITFGWNDPA